MKLATYTVTVVVPDNVGSKEMADIIDSGLADKSERGSGVVSVDEITIKHED